MTFYELIRSSLLMDSKRYRPPGMLLQAVLGALKAKEVCTTTGQSHSSVSSKDSDEQPPSN